jgi:cysteine desulfurase / selenocysteine lyase
MKSGLRSDFPILQRKVNGRPLIYFDNAATSQKPRQVVDAVANFYLNSNANVHRGIHSLAEEATELYDNARKKVAKFINAKSEKEIIFVRNTTEALNLLAYTLKPREVTTTVMEHHSNFLPWKNIAKLNIVGLNRNYFLEKPLTGDFIAVAHASNVLGTINKVPKGKMVVVDGAQAVPHFPVNVAELGCDFYAFSAHKMFGPMGIGVLWGKQELLEKMPPFMQGGGMITMELPDKFEAGTPNVAGAIGLAAAIDYLEKVGWENIERQEKIISDKLLKSLKELKSLKLFGPETNRVPAFSF